MTRRVADAIFDGFMWFWDGRAERWGYDQGYKFGTWFINRIFSK